jgi:hypothetical protein
VPAVDVAVLLVVFMLVVFWLPPVLVVCCCPKAVGLTDEANTDVLNINASPTDNKNRNFLLFIKAAKTTLLLRVTCLSYE